jgi:hypothetical protein
VKNHGAPWASPVCPPSESLPRPSANGRFPPKAVVSVHAIRPCRYTQTRARWDAIGGPRSGPGGNILEKKSVSPSIRRPRASSPVTA